MFRMEFQTLDAVEEDKDLSKMYRNNGDLGKSVYEKYRHKAAQTRVSSPKISEGRVGRVGKLQRTVSSNGAPTDGSHLPEALTRSLSSSASIPQNWVEVDLIDFGSPKAFEEPIDVDEEVLRELVKPFAESVDLAHQPSGKRIDSDVFVTFLDYQPGRSRDLISDAVDYGSFRNIESLQMRSSSMRSSSIISWSDFSDAESSSYFADRLHVKDEEKESPAARAYNRAFNKLMHKKNKPTVQDAKFAKPWEEPLLASHEQLKLQTELQKEAKLEAKRQAEEAKREAEIRKRELVDLADPVPESALRNHEHQHNMRKGTHKLFQFLGGSPREGIVDARESKLVMPRAGLFETCISTSATEVALAQIRSGPRPKAKKDIHFATVESHQRDVKAWTMEEYMARNARLPEWNARVMTHLVGKRLGVVTIAMGYVMRTFHKNDEEFGGIEGNQLLNQYFDDDDIGDFDSDSD